ncbi:hypothetical protein KAH81_03985 [bacterium]|nr:hypothetical protein [bacterium]
MRKVFLLICFAFIAALPIYGGVNRDSLQAAVAEELQDKIFRGEILIHFPLVVFPLDSAGGDVAWIPIPEMGFRFTPTISFRGGWFAFPIRLMGMFPFTDDWVALGDASVSFEAHIPPVHAGVHYRFMRGKVYPVKGEGYAHITGIDLGIPIEGLSGTGVSLDWITYAKLEIGRTYQQSGISWDYYDGNVLTLSPYWTFSPGDYGEITLAYRFPLLQTFKGYDDETQATYDVGKGSFSMVEFRYVYP